MMKKLTLSIIQNFIEHDLANEDQQAATVNNLKTIFKKLYIISDAYNDKRIIKVFARNDKDLAKKLTKSSVFTKFLLNDYIEGIKAFGNALIKLQNIGERLNSMFPNPREEKKEEAVDLDLDLELATDIVCGDEKFLTKFLKRMENHEKDIDDLDLDFTLPVSQLVLQLIEKLDDFREGLIKVMIKEFHREEKQNTGITIEVIDLEDVLW